MPQLPFEKLRNYEQKWVALLEPNQEIVGSGTDAVAAANEARKHGYEDVTLFYVPQASTYFIGTGYGA